MSNNPQVKYVANVRFCPEPAEPARDIFLQAARFHLAAKSIKHEMVSQRRLHLTPPMVTLAAFTVELYLKSLIVLQSNSTMGAPEEHDLAYLFSNVSRSSRDTIKKRFKEKSMASDLGETHQLESVLEQSKDAFVELRYVYEDGGAIGTGFMIWPLLDVLREFIGEKQPEWMKLPLIFKSTTTGSTAA